MASNATGAPPAVRCAIYTRKSTEEGLKQDFNSLDAQRDAATAFIRSQVGEGWKLLPDLYDDGGFTGANMQRPALRRLLADVEAKKVDCVVVYKVVWADLDFGSEAHKAQDLPRTEAEALTIVETVGLEPSVIVRSGFGLHVYWLFDRPVRMGTDAERQWMKSLSRRFQNRLRLQARSLGWTVDPTADLCRVLRVPGTFNRKVPDAVRPVTAEYSGKTYTVDDIGERLGGMEEAGGLLVPPTSVPPQGTPPSLAPAQLPAILDGCAWMRHCRDDAAKLPEPEWYRMLTVVARCEDAERWAHELSRPYSGYTERETRKKLRQASREDIAPVTGCTRR
jgi:hypothetical protein